MVQLPEFCRAMARAVLIVAACLLVSFRVDAGMAPAICEHGLLARLGTMLRTPVSLSGAPTEKLWEAGSSDEVRG